MLAFANILSGILPALKENEKTAQISANMDGSGKMNFGEIKIQK